MNENRFNDLVAILHPYLPSDNRRKSINGFIPSDVRVGIALRCLCGGSPLDICNMFGVRLSTVTAILHEVVAAINQRFTIQFPETYSVQLQIANGFKSRSAVGFNCVVGCIDGLITGDSISSSSNSVAS